MAPTVTMATGGVSPALLTEIERVFSLFQDKIFQARAAEKQLAQQMKIQNSAGREHAKQLIKESNKNIYFILKQAQMNEQKMWDIIKNLQDKHDQVKGEIYDKAMQKARGMASELAALAKHHEAVEFEYVNRLNSMQGQLKAREQEFDELKKKMAQAYEKKVMEALQNKQELMEEQNTLYMKNMQELQDMISSSNLRWQGLISEVSRQYSLRLQELNTQHSMQLQSKIGESYEEIMRKIMAKYKKQDAEFKGILKQSSDMHKEMVKDLQEGGNQVIVSNQLQHQQVLDLMQKHNLMEIEKAKEDVKEVLEAFDVDYQQLRDSLKANHTLEKALENHIKNTNNTLDNNNNNNNTLEWALDNHVYYDENDNLFEEGLPVFENENETWLGEKILYQQVVRDQSVTSINNNTDAKTNNNNNGLPIPIWGISLIALAGLVVLGFVVFGLFKCFKNKKNDGNNNRKVLCSTIPYNDQMELTDEKHGMQHPKLNNDMGKFTVALSHDNSGGYGSYEREIDDRAASL